MHIEQASAPRKLRMARGRLLRHKAHRRSCSGSEYDGEIIGAVTAGIGISIFSGEISHIAGKT